MVSRKWGSPVWRLRCLLAAAATAAALIGPGRSNLDQDRAQCADQLVGLASCLPYVGGDARTPTIDCCTGLKAVLDKSKKCLCVLIRDRDDPNLGLKINATLALGLPSACHAPANITECIDLLHLPANSTDAKLFKGASNGGAASSNSTATPAASANSTSTGGGSASEAKSHGGDRTTKRWWVLEIMCSVLIVLSTSNRMWGA